MREGGRERQRRKEKDGKETERWRGSGHRLRGTGGSGRGRAEEAASMRWQQRKTEAEEWRYPDAFFNQPLLLEAAGHTDGAAV